MAAGAAVFSRPWRGAAQTGLGTLAWIESGSLWVRELPDGPAIKVVDGEELQAPRFSPSRRWISYRNGDDKVFVAGSDGTSGAALDGERAMWVPHQDRLAVQREDGLALFGPEDGWKKPAALIKGASAGAFAPDGDRFVFARDATDAGQLCVASISFPKREPLVLLTNEGGEVQPYGWTRDGKTILYWRAAEFSASLWCDGVDLYAIAAGGGTPRDLTLSTLVHEDSLDLAPNRIVASRSHGRETWAGQRIVTVDLETGATRDLTAVEVAAICPAWSPDGKSIVYSAGPDAGVATSKARAGSNIRIMRPDGTLETKVVTPDMHLGPGGGEEAHRYLHQRKLWMVDAAGANPPRAITSDARYRDEAPMWSAAGSHLLWGRMDYEGHPSLWMMETGGANASQICRLEITGELGERDSWFGYYGYTAWRNSFDWRY